MSSYGLQLKTGSSNNITIADTESDMSNYVAVEYGVGTGTTVDVSIVEDLVFIRYNPDTDSSSSALPQRSVTFSYATQQVPNPNYDPDQPSYMDPYNPEFYTIPTPQLVFNRTVEYIVLKPASSVTNLVGDYGLQIINKENRVQFDSRAASVNKSIALQTYYPVGSVGFFIDIYTGQIQSADLLDSSFDYFYSMNDMPSTVGGILGGSTTTSRALLFVPSGSNNYVGGTSTSSNSQTIAKGVYARTVVSSQSIDLGIISSGSSISYVQKSNDFIIFKGSLVE